MVYAGSRCNRAVIKLPVIPEIIVDEGDIDGDFYFLDSTTKLNISILIKKLCLVEKVFNYWLNFKWTFLSEHDINEDTPGAFLIVRRST